ncbi:uncharacterized protein FIBRA_07765 [Fibroporia radiculosa]|uniref:Uncharacterized protein n=1 Tax=Fibroporia radiculosa TaxID=599839 RepID=J4H4T3_9APHY|nr:uncharacterized protein FIBRA_07765 [Fibroporia radiculosa]CCM05539.1 predicted protein [Fibroporia radiculosa]
MSSRRYNTVHDHAALRLHPDGTRVKNADVNQISRRGKYSVRDVRGNWIAQDAGGLGRVKLRRSIAHLDHADDSHEGETHDLAGAGLTQGEDKEDTTRDGGDDTLRDRRAKKRRRFYSDWTFLETPGGSTSSTTPASAPAGQSSVIQDHVIHEELLKPPSDLLKYIHYFASAYYDAMGQLRDVTKDVQQRKMARKLARLQAGGEEQSQSEQNIETTHRRLNNDDVQHDTTDEESSSSEDESDTYDDHQSRNQSRLQRNDKPNMYKAFDGSALMTIGMLVQEHIRQLLQPSIPDKWEVDTAALEGAKALNGRANGRRRRKPKGLFGSDEDTAEDGDTSDEDNEGFENVHIEGIGRETRGVDLPQFEIPYEDNNSEDEDYTPD